MKVLKRLSALLVAAALLWGCTACGAHSVEISPGTAAAFYYARANAETQLDMDSVVTSEVCYLTSLSLWDYLDEYLKGPTSDDLVSPFPAGVRLLDIQYLKDSLVLTLSVEFFHLKGIDMSLAGYCLASTVCDYTGRNSVVLRDETDSIRLEFTPEQYVLTNDLSQESSESFTVYFSDPSRRYLIAETRNVTLSRDETEAAYVLRKLIEGPESNQLAAIIPEGTRLLAAKVENGLCTVDLSGTFLEGRPEDQYESYLTVYGIVDTLTNLSEIESVRLIVDGNPVAKYGPVDISVPLVRNGDCIGPVRTASGEVDVNLYVLQLETGQFFTMPCRVKQTISQPLAEAVTKKCLSYEPSNGFLNPIPYGTELLNISVSGNICYVDLSEKFIPQDDSAQAENAAVGALVRTLTDLDEISSVVLTIGGESTGLKYVDISEPLRPENLKN